MKISAVVFILLLVSVSAYSLEIGCPLPAADLYKIPAKPNNTDTERIIDSFFSNEPYSMKFDRQYSVFRVFYNRDYTKVVETGFPGYMGVKYFEDQETDVAYFLTKLKSIFNRTNFTTGDIITAYENGMNIFRTRPREINGKSLLFDSSYAGDGAEMAIGQANGRKRVFLKLSWHVLKEPVKLTNTVDFRQLLTLSETVKDKKLTNISLAYFLDADEAYYPCLRAAAGDGNVYFIDALTGEEVRKYRELTGR